MSNKNEKYTVFNKNFFDATQEPIFLGRPVNVARFDQQKYPLYESLTQRQLGFFWRPEEIQMGADKVQFHLLPKHEQDIFLNNLKYQTLLDSIQGRAMTSTLLPLVSLPEFENWVETWGFSETIHSRSYTHIIRNMLNHPDEVFDEIVTDEAIIERAIAVTTEYDKLFSMMARRESGQIIPEVEMAEQIFKVLIVINALEAIRFYVSFACTFSFGERSLLESNCKIMRLIARDESCHCHGTQETVKIIKSGQEGEMWRDVAERLEAFVYSTMREVTEQEMAWADHLFANGSTVGLNAAILKEYVQHRCNVSLQRMGYKPLYPDVKVDPLPWMENWLKTGSLQIAAQEAEQASYLVSQIDSEVDNSALGEFDI